MLVPAPKSLEVDFEYLAECIGRHEKPGDIRRYNIEKKIDDSSNLADRFTGYALLAAIDGNEDLMREYFRRSLQYAPEDPNYEYNFGLVLTLLDHRQEASDMFKQAIAHGISKPSLINSLADNALIIDDPDLQLQVLRLANKLQCNGPDILRLAALVYSANTDNPDEQAGYLSLAISEADLKEASGQISDNAWQELLDNADRLRDYV